MSVETSAMRRAITGALLLWLLTASIHAHELQTNRVTLVLRDQNHLSMTFFISYTDALHRTLAPQQAFQEFLIIYSTMSPQEFQKELQRAQSKFMAETSLTLPSGGQAIITNWNWPDPERVQATLREQVMQAMVVSQNHTHESPVEIRAEVKSSQDISSVRIGLPEAFQQVLVVSYRPSQVWVAPRTSSAVIRF